MPDAALLALLCLIALLIAIALLIVLVLRKPAAGAEAAQRAQFLADLDGLRERLGGQLREEQRDGRGELRDQLAGLQRAHAERIDAFGRSLGELTLRTDQRLDTLRDALTEDARKARQETAEREQRFAEGLAAQLRELTARNEQRLGELRTTLEQKLAELQQSNEAKLEQMRATVDEKLQSTLETRLGESFRLVSERLEQVQRGLGEMQQLATGVGDLKRVLTNVKSRGIYGEVQLAALLEQVFAPDQYASNVRTVPGSDAAVEYAVRFPGSSGEAPVWLPIDAKFPREDYERLLDAQERGDPEAARAAGDALERQVRKQARDIRDKYVAPPHTTEFAILFLPTEGLYAEILRRPGLVEALQRDLRIALAGPTTLLALMTSFQMGFRTLAIQQRSSEVWRTLGAVKTEFGKFGGALDAVKKKLQEATNKIDDTSRRTRVLSNKLRDVEALPDAATRQLLGSDGGMDEADNDDGVETD